MLAVDFGTATTVAVLHFADGRVRPLLFDGSPLLSSTVAVGADGTVLVGSDAIHSGRTRPAAVEPHLKQWVGASGIRLGERDVAVDELMGAVLTRVADEARRILARPPDRVVVTHPAFWDGPRRAALQSALRRAALPVPTLIPEPVAAAAYLVYGVRARLLPGATVLVYDFGGGTFDATLLRLGRAGFEVLAFDCRADVGGLDVDAAIVDSIGARLHASEPWLRLMGADNAADRRARWTFWQDVRAAKEMLSRAPTAPLHVPVVEQDLPLHRSELEQAAAPIVERTLQSSAAVLGAAALTPRHLAAIFLVGGACRMPVVGQAVHRTFGVAPVVVEQPDLAVAEGAVHATLAGSAWGGPALPR
ncbi:hypothetical protein Val02_17320 [Virgisporangium aliadipatigenens]|uniref:Hsp70 family protein n=2 Tax=Virgisporangium aliadipatigenens TaxID=741659 RepID=A0A8J4DPF0_9ACTN|nr:hypothetical protein Val02_17320 [Virgisporangium aliadipatigenens]